MNSLEEISPLKLQTSVVVLRVYCEFLLLWGFGFYGIFFSFLFFSFFFCCLILLIQSQSLSRRTTPFAPRVQVMGPVWRAQSLFGLCSLTVDWPFFCFHTLENAFPGKWQLQVSLSVQCIVSFSSVWFLGTTAMMRVIITHFNPFTSFYQGSACSTNRTHSKRHSSIAWFDSCNQPCFWHFGSLAMQEGVSLSFLGQKTCVVFRFSVTWSHALITLTLYTSTGELPHVRVDMMLISTLWLMGLQFHVAVKDTKSPSCVGNQIAFSLSNESV